VRVGGRGTAEGTAAMIDKDVLALRSAVCTGGYGGRRTWDGRHLGIYIKICKSIARVGARACIFENR